METRKWDANYRLDQTPWRRKNLDLTRLLQITGVQGGTVLDLGCGTGEYSRWLARKGFKVEGLDSSKIALQHAKARFASVNFREWDLEKLDRYEFTYEKYDLILDIKTFVFIQNKEKYLDTIRSRLRGTCVLEAFVNSTKRNLNIETQSIEDLFKTRFNVRSSTAGKMVDYFLN